MNDRIRVFVDTNIIGSALLGGRVAEQFATLNSEFLDRLATGGVN